MNDIELKVDEGQEEAMKCFNHVDLSKTLFEMFRKSISQKHRFRHNSEFVYLAYLIKSCCFLRESQVEELINQLKPFGTIHYLDQRLELK